MRWRGGAQRGRGQNAPAGFPSVSRLGTDGGRTLAWQGKVGLVFGCTGVIDGHYSVIGAMGDRFLLSRMAPSEGQFGRALEHSGQATKQMRRELAEAVAHLFAGERPEPRRLIKDGEEFERLDRVVSLVVRLRGAVERDRHSRDIEAIYGAEGTARLGLTLERLLAGLDTLGVDRAVALDVIESVAMDSVPPLRRRAYEYLQELKPAQVATREGVLSRSGRVSNRFRTKYWEWETLPRRTRSVRDRLGRLKPLDRQPKQ